MRTPPKIRHVAEPKHVREVTLTGSADGGFWSDYLKTEGLTPVRFGEAAEVWVVSAQMAYLGVRFTEVSFSVRVALTQDESVAGMRLIHAFTSFRAFAWCERTMFGTPYSHAACRVSVGYPPSMRIDAPDGCVFSAEMGPPTRPAARAGDENWEGPVFLPPRVARGDGRLFFGLLSGHATTYPFMATDRFTMTPSAAGGALQPLADSRFFPRAWVVRPDATHGKSMTYQRTAILVNRRAD